MGTILDKTNGKGDIDLTMDNMEKELKDRETIRHIEYFNRPISKYNEEEINYTRYLAKQ